MSRKNSVNLNDDALEKRYASWIKIVIDLISPKNLFLVAGRATSKTTDILADRFIDICYDMPGAYFAFVTDTYVNALKNVIPVLIDGFKMKGWVYGIHFVYNEKPPAHFKDPYKIPISYKNTISIFNGCFVNLISMDQPSGGAGNSYQHIFGDETKYLDFNKIKKLTPALRGYKMLQIVKSVYYRGQTFTTDMPVLGDGEHDWILDKYADMDIEQVRGALKVGLVLNELRIERMNHARLKDMVKVQRLDKQIALWEKRWTKVRKNSTFFKIVSSYVNVDLLTVDYFRDILESLGPEEFKTAVATFPSVTKKGDRFYINLSEKHFENLIDTRYYERTFSIGDDEIRESCFALKKYNPKIPIEIGVDFGKMCSIVSGQSNDSEAILLKNFYTLPPDHLRELADQFLTFYQDHPTKEIDMYYDRSGNQYESVKKDAASELQYYLENGQGKKGGWVVNLMSRNQQNIYQEEEYNLMKNILEGNTPGLPKVTICSFGCRELKSSMMLAKTETKKDQKGVTKIYKDKSSEKLPNAKLPMNSTNMSDAGKYFFARKNWLQASARKKALKMGAPSVD